MRIGANLNNLSSSEISGNLIIAQFCFKIEILVLQILIPILILFMYMLMNTY